MKKDSYDFEGEFDIKPLNLFPENRNRKKITKNINYFDKLLLNKDSYPSLDDSNLQYDIVNAFRLLLTLRREQLPKTSQRAVKILSLIESIFNGHATSQAFIYLCMRGAATAWILQNDLDLSEATVYRVLKELRALGFVEPSIKMMKKKDSKGGPRPTLWSLVGSTKEDLANASKLHYRLLSPKYRLAEDLAQTILEEYIIKKQVNEISYKEIVVQIKELKIPFKIPDVAELTAQYLSESGVKVWR